MKIIFLTSNAAKVDLARERLSKYGIDVEQQQLELDEIRSMDVEEVAKSKAQEALRKSSKEFLIEDSAFYIESLNNFPGTFIKMAFDTLGEEKICQLVKNEKNKKAMTKSVLAYGNPKTKEIHIFRGEYEGEIAPEPRGDKARGWKIVRIFIPKGYKKTIAELDDQQWQEFLEKFREGDHFEKFGNWWKNKKSS